MELGAALGAMLPPPAGSKCAAAAAPTASCSLTCQRLCGAAKSKGEAVDQEGCRGLCEEVSVTTMGQGRRRGAEANWRRRPRGSPVMAVTPPCSSAVVRAKPARPRGPGLAMREPAILRRGSGGV